MENNTQRGHKNLQAGTLVFAVAVNLEVGGDGREHDWEEE